MQSNVRVHAIVSNFRSRSGTGREVPLRPRVSRLLTEDKLSDHTVRAHMSPAALEAFVEQYRREAHTAADHVAQLLAALYRFKVRLMRRMQYATIEEQTQPGIVDSTRQRLEDERAALATLNAHGLTQVDEAMRRRDAVAMFVRENGAVLSAEDRKQLQQLGHAVEIVVTSARTMLDEAKSVLAAYTAAAQKLR